MVFPITTVGTSYILENAKIRKRAGFWRDRNLFHVRQLHCPRKFFSTLENLLSRDIVSICYYSHILMKSAVLREFKIWSGAFPFFGVPQIENRNLRASGSSRWLSRISGYVLKVLQYATSEVRVPKTLTFKMRLDAQSFLWKWVLLALLITYPRFETEAQGNSEIAYYRYCP